MSLVKAYNAIQLNGRDRSFPVAELLGSECVVARMWHEHNVSKLYTPVGLGEIIQRRSFTASGDVNPLAKSSKKSASLSLDEENQLIQADDPEWSPKSLLAIIDGVTAAKWAMILTQWGEEHLVEEYTTWMIQRARSRPAKIEPVPDLLDISFLDFGHVASHRQDICWSFIGCDGRSRQVHGAHGQRPNESQDQTTCGGRSQR